MNTRNRKLRGAEGSGRLTTRMPQVLNNDDTETEAPAQNIGHHEGRSQSGPDSQHHEQGEIHARSSRTAWTLAEMKEIIWCYEYGKFLGMAKTNETYEIWRHRNPNTRLNIDANKLANQRRYIMRNRKIDESILEEIQKDVLENIEAEAITEAQHIEEEEEEEDFMTPPESPVSVSNSSMKTDILMKLYEVQMTQMQDRNRLPRIVNNQARELIKDANLALEQILAEGRKTITEINELIYAAASVVSEKLMPGKKNSKKRNNRNNATLRIENQIQKKRSEISILVEYKKGNVKKKNYKVKNIRKKYGIENEDDLVKQIELLKQRVTAKTQRRRRIEKRIQQFRQNRTFQTNQKQIYRELRKDNTQKQNDDTNTDIKSVEDYWSNIFEKETSHNKNAAWLKDFRLHTEPGMVWTRITIEDISAVLKRTQNWKSPGLDQLQNYWLKKFTPFLTQLTRCYNEVIEEDVVPPDWFTKGITTLIPKTQNPNSPKDYRPITCLPTMYKLFTAVIASKLGKYLTDNNVIPVEQKGCCKNSAGCKDQLLISKMILDDCQERRGNLAVAWIDYRKAFDSVPHSWLIKALELAGAAPEILKTCKMLMKKWSTSCILRKGQETQRTRLLRIKRAIFQGDSLSPLMFCVAMAPVSNLIRNADKGYKLKEAENYISHLLYMDDLKLITTAKTKLQNQIQAVKMFINDIKMSFGVDKCATMAIRHGKVQTMPDIAVEEGVIKQLNNSSFYKYLGIEESLEINHTGMKKKLMTEYYTRIRAILKSQLNAKNKMSAIGALAIPVLQYSFGIVNWTLEEIKGLDRKTRKLLYTYDSHHPQASIDRLYVPRAKGGRGLLQIEKSYKTAIINMACYLHHRSEVDSIVKIIKEQDSRCRQSLSITKKAHKYLEELELSYEDILQVSLQSAKHKVKELYATRIENNWRNKEMYGQYLRDIEQNAVDKESTFLWLRYAGLKVETESLLVAAQDQALRTRYRENRIFNLNIDSKCRVCKQAEETITHVLSGCQVLAQSQYIERHDKVAKLLHYNICKEYNMKVVANWYDHTPKQVITTDDGGVTILWNVQIQTDRTISANKPDIVIKNHREMQCKIIDVAIPADNNVVRKEAEKILKYSDLKIDIQRMWSMKTEVIPVVIGVTGVVSKRADEYLSKLPGNHRLQEIQKTAMLGTANIIRKTI